MKPVDHTILEFCRDGLRPLKALRGQLPPATLYRHVHRLEGLGLLQRDGYRYGITEAGLRQLTEARSGRQWDALGEVYPPLVLVPTATHRALIELILAAVAVRQQGSRPDRHPYFVAFGGTLRWKTSLGSFVCHLLGLDPALHVVDCPSESGKSLSVRRSGTGSLVSKRELLDGPFLVLDEFQAADPSIRSALGIFLSGRMVVPFEHDRLTVRPVALVTLNPQAKATLESRIGLSAPQIRRAILADFDRVPMPDLAMTGERALAAARAHAPMRIPAPAVDCQAFRRPIVELTRAILVPEAHERVDVEIVVNLCTGMTAFIPEPADAIAQVAYALGVLAETLGWARSGWIEPLTRVSLDSAGDLVRSSPGSSVLATRDATREDAAKPDGTASVPARLSLEVRRPARRESGVPELSLSDELRARVIWLAVDTGRSVEEALTVLLGIYQEWRKDADTLATLETVLRLARELKIREVDVETLEGYLKALEALAEHHCTLDDVPQALRLIELLAELPEPWDWPRARAAIQAVALVLRNGIPLDQVQRVLARHQRLVELGFGEDTAEAVAEALLAAGATGDRRDEVLRVLAANATRTVDRAALETACQQLTAERDELRQRIKPTKTRLANLQAHLEAYVADLAALRGLRAVLLGKPAEIGPFLADVERLQQWRRQGRVRDPQYAAVANDLRVKVVKFFQQLVAQLQGP